MTPKDKRRIAIGIFGAPLLLDVYSIAMTGHTLFSSEPMIPIQIFTFIMLFVVTLFTTFINETTDD